MELSTATETQVTGEFCSERVCFTKESTRYSESRKLFVSGARWGSHKCDSLRLFYHDYRCAAIPAAHIIRKKTRKSRGEPHAKFLSTQVGKEEKAEFLNMTGNYKTGQFGKVSFRKHYGILRFGSKHVKNRRHGHRRRRGSLGHHQSFGRLRK